MQLLLLAGLTAILVIVLAGEQVSRGCGCTHGGFSNRWHSLPPLCSCLPPNRAMRLHFFSQMFYVCRPPTACPPTGPRPRVQNDVPGGNEDGGPRRQTAAHGDTVDGHHHQHKGDLVQVDFYG